MSALETVDLDGVGIKLKTVLGSEEFLHCLTLVTLELNHLAHLGVSDDGAIAGCLVAQLAYDAPRHSDSRLGEGGGQNLPNFFLTTARIFLRENLGGMP